MSTDHVKMLCDIGELNSLFSQSISKESFLARIVELVAEHLKANVCSIYLFQPQAQLLVLKATVGLLPQAVDTVQLHIGEGLVGKVLKELRPIREGDAALSENFKLFPGINEEQYHSFIGIPIVRGTIRIGVLVVQRKKINAFSERDVFALQATASQLATIIENVKFLLTPREDAELAEYNEGVPAFIKGKAASVGFARAPVAQYAKKRTADLAELGDGSAYTVSDLDTALKETAEQLERLQERVEERMSDAASLFFTAHLLMLKDDVFTGALYKEVEKGKTVPDAIFTVFRWYRERFALSRSRLIREKVQDLEDLIQRILNNLVRHQEPEAALDGTIVVARELFPTDILRMSVENIVGLVLVSGGVTSHVAFLARSLGIPMIIADEHRLLVVPEGTEVLLDAELGNIYIDPDPDVVSTFEQRNKARVEGTLPSERLLQPAKTADGVKIEMLMNVNLISDISHLPSEAIDGIGLYRTEFPFLVRPNFPSEEEQLLVYSKLMEASSKKPVTFRTLDIGGDKVLSYYQMDGQANPFLGMRSVRFSLTHMDVFKQQIRAILRAGSGHDIKIMFPMISSLDEFCICRDTVHECIQELHDTQLAHNAKPAIGLMVEIPSVIDIIDDIALEADFMSVGTNDLIQYMLAVDRTNEKVADMYIPHHPAVLRALQRIAAAGIKHNCPVSVCGDMASDRVYVPFLLGIGIRALSVDALYIPRIKRFVSQLAIGQTEEIACAMLQTPRISGITEILAAVSRELGADV